MFLAAFRTNAVFVMAFFSLFLAFTFFAVSRFYGADGNLVLYERFQMVRRSEDEHENDVMALTWQIKAAGGAGFATCMFGWWLLIVEVLTTVDFPYNLPVFDLSGVVPGASDLSKRKRGAAADQEER